MKKIHLLKYNIAILTVITIPFAMAESSDNVDSNTTEAIPVYDSRTEFLDINNKATEFITVYNKEHHTNLHTVEVNGKYYLPRCLVPLKAGWKKAEVHGGKIPFRYVISISCEKSKDDRYRKKWDIDVYVRNEQGNSIQSID